MTVTKHTDIKTPTETKRAAFLSTINFMNHYCTIFHVHEGTLRTGTAYADETRKDETPACTYAHHLLQFLLDRYLKRLSNIYSNFIRISAVTFRNFLNLRTEFGYHFVITLKLILVVILL